MPPVVAQHDVPQRLSLYLIQHLMTSPRPLLVSGNQVKELSFSGHLQHLTEVKGSALGVQDPVQRRWLRTGHGEATIASRAHRHSSRLPGVRFSQDKSYDL